MDLGHSFHGKSFVKVEIIFFRSKFGEISPEKKTLLKTHYRMRGVITNISF
jgi:hypothetical protein